MYNVYTFIIKNITKVLFGFSYLDVLSWYYLNNSQLRSKNIYKIHLVNLIIS